MTDLLFSKASRRSWLKQGAALSLAATGSLRAWAQPRQTTLVLGDQAAFDTMATDEGWKPYAVLFSSPVRGSVGTGSVKEKRGWAQCSE